MARLIALDSNATGYMAVFYGTEPSAFNQGQLVDLLVEALPHSLKDTAERGRGVLVFE